MNVVFRILTLSLVLCFLSPLSVRSEYSPAASIPKVEVFVTEWCGYCRRLESFLKQKKIIYQRFDIERSRYGKQVYERHGKGGVPLVIIESEHVVRGYQPGRIMALLDRLRRTPQGTGSDSV